MTIFLGGKDNFEADRVSAEKLLALVPRSGQEEPAVSVSVRLLAARMLTERPSDGQAPPAHPRQRPRSGDNPSLGLHVAWLALRPQPLASLSRRW